MRTKSARACGGDAPDKDAYALEKVVGYASRRKRFGTDALDVFGVIVH